MTPSFSASDFQQKLFAPQADFDSLTDELWAYQSQHNPIMGRYLAELGTRKRSFIPISFFKQFEMKSGPDWQAEAVFESSGTTGQTPSRHFVRDLSLYRQAALQGFFHFFPNKSYRILALLPSYLERGNSSLVQMVKLWIDEFGLPGSGFYLYNFEALRKAITEASEAGEPIILIGVAFALLDFVEEKAIQMPSDSIILETGGMKGRKEEIIRDELHARLSAGLGVENIGSEYGMTELLSQAYALKAGRFLAPPWLRVFISDIYLPHLPKAPGRSGRINLIDLANVHSCAFISTDDIGRLHADGSFEVLGRLDQSEMRGCSLMYG
jgi:phenylacetate-coenzyme A ligase PaaK-like adenylate-forming protein